jgi:hypothetical protein
MASTGFVDATRLASGDPRMSHDIWVTNRESLIHWLDRMAAELQTFRSMLEDARDDELLEIFAGARVDRDAFLNSPPTRIPEKADTGASSDTRKVMMDMMVGGMMGDKLRKMRDLSTGESTTQEDAPAKAPANEPEAPEKQKPPSLGDRIAEGVRRDLEKMERERAEKEARKQQSGD